MSSKESKKQEKKIANDLHGGRVQIASGALPWWKNDVQSEEFLVEAKYTENKSYSLKRVDFEKLNLEAVKLDKIPVMVIELKPGLTMAVLRYEDFLAYDEMLSEMT